MTPSIVSILWALEYILSLETWINLLNFVLLSHYLYYLCFFLRTYDLFHYYLFVLFSQAAHLLQAPKACADDITGISSTCFKLNSLQLRALLQNYVPGMGEPRIPHDLIEKIVQVTNLLLHFPSYWTENGQYMRGREREGGREREREREREMERERNERNERDERERERERETRERRERERET